MFTRRGALLLLGLLASVPMAPALRAEGATRVIAAGGSVAEIVFALGAGDRLIARDSTSSFPPEVLDLPDIGYLRTLSAENLLALSPDLILAEHDAGPPEAVEILQRSGIPLIVLPEAFDAEGVATKIAIVAEALGLPERGAALSGQVRASFAQAAGAAAALPHAPKVMFILSMQGGRLMVSGRGTSADAMIRLAGGQNAVDGYEGYKALTDEAAIAAAPEIILVMDRSGDLAVTLEDIRAHPALSLTPAARNGHVVAMDGLYLLGFGPRAGKAAQELAGRFGDILAGQTGDEAADQAGDGG
ncbi:heme/hemin ABC transporter substrate-binding protein [Rubellimicrobium thermophilum]|nr:ABC transporter substrate-binding protein [Rubellimicrobium thermophilum]